MDGIDYLEWRRIIMDYNIMEYGAVADGTTNNSGAIQAAVDACTEAGGGRVIVRRDDF